MRILEPAIGFSTFFVILHAILATLLLASY